jgi:hypothetical protein
MGEALNDEFVDGEQRSEKLNAINTVIKEMAWSRNCGMII